MRRTRRIIGFVFLNHSNGLTIDVMRPERWPRSYWLASWNAMYIERWISRFPGLKKTRLHQDCWAYMRAGL
jgi:hypothetical protein